MAYGIEELTEMQVTGPVQGGDMVAKPNEMPVGAAALLSKMQKKNTPGIFKLPEADKKMPNFMKVAAEGVEEQNTANLEDSEIMRIMGTYGVGPEEARRIYDEMIYGYERDEAAISPTDWRTILKMIESGMSQEEIDAQLAMNQGPTKDLTINDIANLDKASVQAGVLNFLGEQPEVTVPVKAKSHEDSPPVELAYITDEEKDLLVKANIHGTMDGTPNPGPGGIQSLDDFFNTPGGGVGGGSTGRGERSGSRRDYGIGDGQAVTSGGNVMEKDDKGDWKKVSKEEQKAAEQQAERFSENVGAGMSLENARLAEQNFQEKMAVDAAADSGGFDALTGIWNKIKGDPLYQNIDDIPNIDEIIAEIERYTKYDNKIEGLGFGAILGALRGGPYKDKDKLWRGEEGSEIDEDVDERTLEGIKKFIRDKGGAKALESLKNLRPELYYKVVNPQTVGSIEELGKMGAAKKNVGQDGKITYTMADGRTVSKDVGERLNRQIFEAREQASRSKDSNQNRGGGGGGAPITEVAETITENIDVDPRAGAFNVGGTMKYKDDLRTGGKEMDVPLGRRFAIDKGGKFRGSTPMGLNEAVKYATLGGYNQLEPFQEYLTRRRKELGEQPDEYFDEEGNVIYSKQA